MRLGHRITVVIAALLVVAVISFVTESRSRALLEARYHGTLREVRRFHFCYIDSLGIPRNDYLEALRASASKDSTLAEYLAHCLEEN